MHLFSTCGSTEMGMNAKGTMAMRMIALACTAALALGSAQSARSAEESGTHHVVPLKVRSGLATDKRFETVSGDPTISGAPFVVRIHAEAGYVIMPHTHLVDENIVVLKGSWALGMGEHFRREALEPMEVGDYGFAPRNMVHFAFSKTATIIQVHGVGPFATTWLVPMYELSTKGVVIKSTAGDQGRGVAAPPDGCFSMQIGARVRSEHREGAIVGAQCTPGILTQYRVEGSDGELFWARPDELSML
jgi:hypothetical protein